MIHGKCFADESTKSFVFPPLLPDIEQIDQTRARLGAETNDNHKRTPSPIKKRLGLLKKKIDIQDIKNLTGYI